MPSIISTDTPLARRLQRGDTVRLKDLKGFIAGATQGSHVPRADIKQLEDLYFRHDGQLTPGARSHLRRFLETENVHHGYSALRLRTPYKVGSWPVDNTPNVLDLSQPLNPQGRTGSLYRVGMRTVQNMLLTLRRVVDVHKRESLEAAFELSRQGSRGLADKLVAAGARFECFEEHESFVDSRGRLVFTDTKPSASRQGDFGFADASRSLVLETAQFRIDYFPEETAEQALRGKIWIRAFGTTEAERRSNLQAALAATTGDAAVKSSGPASQRVHLKMRLLWQASPRAAYRLSKRRELVEAEVDAALKSAKVPDDFLRKVRYAEIMPGYSTAVVPGMGKRYAQHGATMLVHATLNADRIVDMVLGDGLLSTIERMQRGIVVGGMSSNEDLKTGGADYVFTRMLHRDFGSVATADLSRFVMVMKPAILDRTDWFAYEGDAYGTTSIEGDRRKASKSVTERYTEAAPGFDGDFQALHNDTEMGVFAERQTGKTLMQTIKDKDSGTMVSNEFMFRQGIPLRDIDHVAVADKRARNQLLRRFEAAGIDTINGAPAADFVRVTKDLLATGSGADGDYV